MEHAKPASVGLAGGAPEAAIRAQWLVWLTRARFFGISLSLAVELLVALRDHTAGAALAPFLYLIAAWYGIALLERAWLRSGGRVAPQVYTQLGLDVLLVTGVIAATGGYSSLLTEIYALLVVASAALLPRRVIYAMAGLCALAYWGAAEAALEIGGLGAPANDRAMGLSVLLNGLAFLAAAYLAELLAGQLMAAGRQLRENQHVLASLRALNDNIIRSMGGGLLTTDLSGRIHLVNPAAERILEQPAAELLGQPADGVLGAVPEGMFGRRGEIRVTRHGREKIIGLTVVPLRVEGTEAAGRVIHFQDLTELRRLERDLRRQDRMAAVGRMAAGIAHEIRNPLASMAGSVRLLARSAGHDAEQQRLAAVVERESERLNRIVGDFLGYARDYHYHMAEVDLRGLLEEVLMLAQQSPRRKTGIAVEAALGTEPIPVWGDGDRLKQVFWNLCDNAFKAMPEGPGGGVLRITAMPSSLGVRLEFEDTGRGLKPGSEEEIFEPFRSGFAEGTGLGLALVYAIVEAHQGKIWAEPPVSGGARFVIQLPLERAVGEARSAAPAPDAPTAEAEVGQFIPSRY
ncbi:MAG: two-component system sensor histidine kinase NtrB [Terriglobales bacterium]